MEIQETDLILQPPSINNDAFEIIERRNLLYERVLSVAIKSTSKNDWIDQNGKPYLQGSGAEKVARRFGVIIFDVEIYREDYEDNLGKYYIFTVSGKAGFSKNEFIEAIGTCSTRDNFFGRVGNKFKSIEDVSIPNVKKKSYTNFIVNSITRLLGLRNLSWDNLDAFGYSKNGSTSIKYDKGASHSENSNIFKDEKKKPYWESEYNGKKYLWANSDAFPSGFLQGLGFRVSQKNPKNFSNLYSENLIKLLDKELNI